MPETENPSQFHDFEKLMEELKTIVRQLESGDATLEASIEKFERGMRLVREGQKILANAEQKIQYLARTDQGEKLVEGKEEGQ